MDPGPAPQLLERSALVFEGRVLSITDRWDGSLENLFTTENEFEVLRAWKGTHAGARVVVYTAALASSCAEDYSVGDKILVYALESRGKLITGYCNGAKLSEYAASDYAALGPPLAPGAEGGCGIADIASGPVLSTQALLGMTALLGFVGVRRIRRNRRR